MLLVFFALVFLELESHFLPRPTELQFSYFMFPNIIGMTSAYHHTQLLVEMGFCKRFAQAGLKPQSYQFQHPK
jgi:hypothetical protein